MVDGLAPALAGAFLVMAPGRWLRNAWRIDPTIFRQAYRIQIDCTVNCEFCMGLLRFRQWCQSRRKIRFALHSDASTEAVNACGYTPPSKINVLFNLGNSRQWKDKYHWKWKPG
jgi:hypothetical protein